MYYIDYIVRYFQWEMHLFEFYHIMRFIRVGGIFKLFYLAPVLNINGLFL